MSKKCSSCKETKGFLDFHKHSGRKDGYNQSCKVCHNMATVERSRKKRKERQALLAELKNVSCACCGNFYPDYAMQFHHIDPTTKTGEVSQMINGKLSVLLDEIAKCVVVCANCHLGIERGILNV